MRTPAARARERAHERFRAFVLDDAFPCIGARSALLRGDYHFGLYADLASPEATRALAADLARYVATLPERAGGFTTFVASFRGPLALDEGEFETLLWRQLQALHDHDEGSEWDPSVSADPASPEFAFSFAGQAFFVVGLHGGGSRLARRYGEPTLVLNPHPQFRRLRAAGRFTKLQALIRERDLALQGSLNPNLSDFGSVSEARQYAGRAVEAGWRCPFHARQPASQEEAQP